MSKLLCLCGGTISDSVFPGPAEGWLLREQDQERYHDGISRDFVAFFAAIQSGRRNAWIAEFFSWQYPIDESDEAVVYDIVSHHKELVDMSVAECETCGRLWIQRDPGVNEYRSYSPDKQGYIGILQSPAAESAEPNSGSDPCSI